MSRIKKLLIQYKDILAYLIFGILTTVVNVLIYHVFYKVIGIGNIPSTILAWVVAVTFAFITNKLFVFESKTWNIDALKEAWRFLVCRMGTGVLEVGMMYVFVDSLGFNGTLMKLITNVLVIAINYIASKLVIFKKTR